MGGVVAFEMARQVEAAGGTVELLALVDPSPVGDGEERPHTAMDDLDLLRSFAQHMGIPTDRIAVEAQEILALNPAERLQHAWEAARAADALPPDLDLARFESLWNVFKHNVEAVRRYHPGRCAAEILVVCAEDRRTPITVEAARWQALTSGSVATMTSPGNHFSMLREPHAGHLAGLISGALSKPP
jgi:thioesterase domain-containing protein